MTIFDYLKKNCEVAIYTDEYGNTYMETKEWEYEKIISGAIEISNKADDAIVWLIPKEVYEKHSKLRSLLLVMSQSIPFEMSAGPITG